MVGRNPLGRITSMASPDAKQANRPRMLIIGLDGAPRSRAAARLERARSNDTIARPGRPPTDAGATSDEDAPGAYSPEA